MNVQAPPFKVSTAIASYYHAVDLIGRQSFIGVVGPNEVVTSVNNGVTISGALCQPVNSAIQISGKLSWLRYRASVFALSRFKNPLAHQKETEKERLVWFSSEVYLIQIRPPVHTFSSHD
jgi:hypothetical protein